MEPEEEIHVESPTPARISKKCVTVFVLLMVNLLNYMDRFTIAGVLTQLTKFFDMNDKEAGMLQTVFIIFYMLCAPVFGYLGDRYNRKMILSCGLFVWIFAVLGSSFVSRDHFNVFMFLRGLVGVGEASYSTIAPTIIADMFAGAERSKALMVFYFAIPFGSGMGYIGGAYASLWFGGWQWGVRFTPLLGLICLCLLMLLVEEPARGAAEHGHTVQTSIKEDLLYLYHIKTFILNTCAFTSVVFAVGALSWWIPSLMEHAYAVQHGTSIVPDSEKARISLQFGLITCLAGVFGVLIGSNVARAWREGSWGIRPSHKADAYVCAAGSLLAMPCLYVCLLAAVDYIKLTWVLMFVGITCMCLNWSVNMDMLMYTVVANRRATATAIQTLVSHLFGDASSPYVIGIISDAIRGNDASSFGSFFALQHALFITTFMLVFSGGFYLWASFHIITDHHNALRDMGAADPWPEDVNDDVETLYTVQSTD